MRPILGATVGLLWAVLVVGCTDDTREVITEAVQSTCERNMRCEAEENRVPETIEECERFLSATFAALERVRGEACVQSTITRLECELERPCGALEPACTAEDEENDRACGFENDAETATMAGVCASGVCEQQDLQIVETAPADGQTEVPVDTRIGFRTNAPIDPASLTSETFFLTDDQGTRVPSDVFTGEEPDIGELRPDAPLAAITSFTVTVKAGLASSAGATLEDDFEWNFTTLDRE